MPAKATVPRTCAICGSAFLAKPHLVKAGLGLFCSRVCAGRNNGHERIKTTWQERFWAKVDKNGPVPPHAPELGPCWLWTGGVFRYRAGGVYGAFRKDGQNRAASRVSLEMALGHPLPSNVWACHRCDVPLCVRPDHLFAGTQLDNMRDMHAKGRWSKSKSRHTMLSEAQNQNATTMSSR